MHEIKILGLWKIFPIFIDKYFTLYHRKNNHVISKLLYNIITLIQFYSRNYIVIIQNPKFKIQYVKSFKNLNSFSLSFSLSKIYSNNKFSHNIL